MTFSPERRGLTRRQFTTRAGALLAALGVGGAAGYELHQAPTTAPPTEPVGPTAATIPTAGNPGSGVESFVTRPDLRPASVRITYVPPPHHHIGVPRFVVMAPMADIPYQSVQRGPMLVDRRGRLIWYRPGPDSTFDVQVQQYRGQRVMTWWHGDLVGGHGLGVGEIIDESYEHVATVGHATQRPIDLHEFQLTSRGTALATFYEQRATNLSSIGGPANGQVLVCHALEIDVATNETLLDWVSTDHVALDESYQPLPSSAATPYDYFHMNSIGEASDGNLLISGRNTWCVYKVHRTTGEVLWRMGGKRSDFKVDDDAGFSWQHHVRAHGSSQLTIFDNALTSGHGSLALLLDVDEAAKHVRLAHAYQHPAKFIAWTLGSVQVRPNGNVFVGWGAQPYFSEFTHDGTLISDGQFNSETRSYRTFLTEWHGRPTDKPTIVARAGSGAGSFTIYVSWNGATEVAEWAVYAGVVEGALQQVGSQPWSGFETTIIVNSTGPLFQVAAIDRHGAELGRSDVT